MIMVPKILIVDDEENIRGLLQEVLQAVGYQTFEATNGAQAIHLFEAESPDLVMLDIAMPGLSGFQVLRQLRKTSKVPVIMLSARIDTIDKVESLQLGADDYITKPFEIEEMAARVEAVLRRRGEKPGISGRLVFNDGRLMIDFTKRCVTLEGKAVELTPKEYSLLRELILNAGSAIEYQRLLKNVWGIEYEKEKNLVQAVVKRLRSKIEIDPKKPEYILAVEGIGYRFKAIP
jgi:two-component system OmpR family response regulator/two-component system alkaline phosphatase synthesis response regulator PhoP